MGVTPAESVLDYLCEFPVLEYIDVDDAWLSETTLTRLSSRGAKGDWSVLPRLKHVVFLGRDPYLAKRLLDMRNGGEMGCPSLTIDFVTIVGLPEDLADISRRVPFVGDSGLFYVANW